MSPLTRTYIGIGSNLDHPMRQVTSALEELAAIDDSVLIGHSAWYQSKAIGPGEQADYINGAACLDTSLDPFSLLNALQSIEQAHKRIRSQHWGPRTLDLDLLLYGDRVINSPILTVPHPYLSQRNFVLFPLSDLPSNQSNTPPDNLSSKQSCNQYCNIVLPNGVSIESLLSTTSHEGIVRLTN